MDLDLAGRRALVTGSSRGTGEGIAKVLAREGAQVLVHGLADGDGARVCAEIIADGGAALACWGDITTDSGAETVARQVEEGTGGIDILVNNYGTADRGSWFDTDSAGWISSYEKNVLPAARMIRFLVPAMKALGWGRVIQLGTIGSFRPNARMPHYYSAKGALATMGVSLAKELAGSGVTVNTVSPGLTRTREVEESYRKLARRKGWGEEWRDIEAGILRDYGANPVGRIGRVEEVGDLVAFLASPRADFINGVNIRIDGGATDQVN